MFIKRRVRRTQDFRHPKGDALSAPKARGTIQRLFLCAAKKKPLAVKRKRQRGICVGTNFTSLASARDAKSRPFRCSSFSHANRFAGFAREPLLWNPLKTTKEEVIPLPWIYLFSKNENYCNVATVGGQGRPPLRFIRLKMSRISYVKYSTGANGTIRKIYRAVRKPDLAVARKGVP